jgi:hypothetical protein
VDNTQPLGTLGLLAVVKQSLTPARCVITDDTLVRFITGEEGRSASLVRLGDVVTFLEMKAAETEQLRALLVADRSVTLCETLTHVSESITLVAYLTDHPLCRVEVG